MGKTLVFLFLFLVTASFAEMNQLRIEGKAKFQDGIMISKDIVDKNMEQAALIVFLTDLDVDIVFRPSNGLVRPVLDRTPGRYEVFVSPGERYITVNATKYQEFEVVLSTYGIRRLRSGEVYELKITSKAKENNIAINIFSDQEDASVFLDNTYVGFIKNGLLQVENIFTGKHLLKIKKPGFKPYNDDIYVSLESNSFTATLFAAELDAVDFRFTSYPSGAEIYIDNKLQVDSKTSCVIPLYPDKYEITLKLDEYIEHHTEITVSQKETKILHYDFLKNDIYNNYDKNLLDLLYLIKDNGSITQFNSGFLLASNPFNKRSRRGGSVFFNTLYTSAGLQYHFPILAKGSVIVPIDSYKITKSYYAGASLIGDMIIGQDSAIIDLLSLNCGLILSSNSLRHRLILDVDAFGKMIGYLNNKFKLDSGVSIVAVDEESNDTESLPLAWVPFHLSARYENIIYKSIGLSVIAGAFIITPPDVNLGLWKMTSITGYQIQVENKNLTFQYLIR